MLLAVDIGNTQTVVGLFAADKLLCNWRFASDKTKTEDEYFALLAEVLRSEDIKVGGICRMIVSSVVPQLSAVWRQLAAKYLTADPILVDCHSGLGIKIAVDNPAEVGADRLINAVAAYSAYGGPLIIVDFGTATTLDCVNAGGAYIGGAIAPGVEIAKNALFEHAARLASVPMDAPPNAIGKNTAQCLQSGILFGFAAQVDGLAERMKKELDGTPKVIATGGIAPLIAPYSQTIDKVDLLLTLKGLYLASERIKG